MTHCIPRLLSVIEGDGTGVGVDVGWKGGGGFRFHTLGEPVFDADGGIHPAVRFATLASFVWMQETGQPLKIPPNHPASTGSGHASTKVGPQCVDDGAPLCKRGEGGISPLLGVHSGTAYYLLYNGILGDRRPQGGNVLTSLVLSYLESLFPHDGPRVIYGETTRLGEIRLREAGITFKQIPYDIKAC